MANQNYPLEISIFFADFFFLLDYTIDTNLVGWNTEQSLYSHLQF